MGHRMESGARGSAHVIVSKAKGNVTCEAIVVAVCKLVIEKDRYRCKVVFQLTGQSSSVLFWNLEARPAVPCVWCRVGQATHSAYQST